MLVAAALVGVLLKLFAPSVSATRSQRGLMVAEVFGTGTLENFAVGDTGKILKLSDMFLRAVRGP